MAKTKRYKMAIRKGMFFPSDFKRMPEKTVIYIERGLIIDLKAMGEVIEDGKKTKNKVRNVRKK
jgi:hypothetical protein